MGEMFKQTSDLSGLFVKPKELRVSKAIHKAVIEVNEDGSEASAATGNQNCWTFSKMLKSHTK